MKIELTRNVFTGLVCLLLVFESNAAIDTAAVSATINQEKDKTLKNSVVLIHQNGKQVYKKETGEYNVKTQLPVGAASQWLTAAMVMLFVQDGILSLDDKVSEYIPLFAKHGKAYITIGHCLTFNTGIQNDMGVTKIFQRNKFHSLEEEVNDYASKREIETNPGTESNYSNVGFNIAARVLEIVSKKTLRPPHAGALIQAAGYAQHYLCQRRL